MESKIPGIPFIIVCTIIALVLLYKPFFGDTKDFLACLDAFLTSGRSGRYEWLKNPKKKDDAKSMKMTLFLVLAFVSGMIGSFIVEPAFKWLGL